MDNIMATISALFPFILLIAIFYFMLWRPQKKEQLRRQRMLNALKRGDKVITNSGIYGQLTVVGETKVTLKVAENVEIEMNRTAIGAFQDAAKQERVEKGE
ncbi:MAG: preprotein translocase subunit YajC [Succiniclasticum sp.]|jgi:preprotein translocase subunit YajC|nr:preprotein translocase subunit YajC [Succiniclasticum sp.]MCI6223355.1 preprotein translocase subunit YajC [Selenomonadales bacterium]MDY2869737.1 preprotein translocase subunit YajC [Succiniclasticum sp.]MDY6303179.1 preprotein translocase subunit YajC [Succiniclasticum sp.]MDY6346508.1 preprotein translocase subunit YajC [Succiniclasticum sp.]